MMKKIFSLTVFHAFVCFSVIAQSFYPQNVIKIYESGGGGSVSQGFKDSVTAGYNTVKAVFKQGASAITVNPATEVTLLDQPLTMLDATDFITLRFYALINNQSGASKIAILRVYLNGVVVTNMATTATTGGQRRAEIDPLNFATSDGTVTSFVGRGLGLSQTVLNPIYASAGNPIQIKVTAQVLSSTAAVSVQRVSSILTVNNN